VADISVRAQEVCESRGGRPGFPVPNKPTVSVDVKQHFNISVKERKKARNKEIKTKVFGLYESDNMIFFRTLFRIAYVDYKQSDTDIVQYWLPKTTYPPKRFFQAKCTKYRAIDKTNKDTITNK